MPPKKTTGKSTSKTPNSAAKPVKKPPQEPSKATPTSEEVAQAAYYRWLSRGGQHGDSEKDWFEAEKELLKKKRNP